MKSVKYAGILLLQVVGLWAVGFASWHVGNWCFHEFAVLLAHLAK